MSRISSQGSGLDWGFVGDMKSTSSTLRFIALGTNVGGLVVTALLLSLISDAVQTKYDSMRKGSSAVTVRFDVVLPASCAATLFLKLTMCMVH